jgi:hypothetical protein
MLEEGKYERSVELFDLEPIWSDTEPTRREANQNAEAVGIGFTGVRACSPLLRQVLAEEDTEVWRNRGHAAPP